MLIAVSVGSCLGQALGPSLEIGGQISGIASYSPDSSFPYFLGARYIPKLEYGVPFENGNALDFMVSANLSATNLFDSFDDGIKDLSVKPYRVWARYTSEQLELRMGLQKIDFGSATILRPLQWFNQVDPRDPLQITNGVYGFLGRYYFLNNSNLWLWALIGNEDRRGSDFLAPKNDYPELGGRFQYPVANGELALSIHHRKVDGEITTVEETVENRIGLDGKFDLLVGLWFEATLVRSKELETRQLSLGSDYSFDFGNGLNLGAEHQVLSFTNRPFDIDMTRQFSAVNLSYPLSFFDQISSVVFYDWTRESVSIFLNYGHQFTRFDAYLMTFYNSTSSVLLGEADFIDSFSGAGVRAMAVVNF